MIIVGPKMMAVTEGDMWPDELSSTQQEKNVAGKVPRGAYSVLDMCIITIPSAARNSNHSTMSFPEVTGRFPAECSSAAALRGFFPHNVVWNGRLWETVN
jgi:hypothetical protein